jgi:hypothetical protein
MERKASLITRKLRPSTMRRSLQPLATSIICSVQAYSPAAVGPQ